MAWAPSIPLVPALERISTRFASQVKQSGVSAPCVLAATHELLQATPPKLIHFKTSINAVTKLICLPPSVLRHIAELVDAPNRLEFSNVCRALRSILLEDPLLWNRVVIGDTRSEIAAAHWERAGQSPLHLNWTALNATHKSANNMRDHSDLVFRFLPRLRTLSLRTFSAMANDRHPQHIGEFLNSMYAPRRYDWVRVPEAFVRWSLQCEDQKCMLAEQLEVLSIDFGSSWTPQAIWDGRSLEYRLARHWHLRWQIPRNILATATNLRTLILRGTAFPADMIMEFSGLREFAYSGMTILTPTDLNQLLKCMPILEGLALGCPFQEDSQSSQKGLGFGARPSRIAITWQGEDDAEPMLRYFVERDMKDIIAINTDISLDPNPSQEVCRVSHDVGCISFGYGIGEGVRRIRRSINRHFDKYYTTPPFWVGTVIELTIHEGVWEALMDLTVKFARLEYLRVRFRRRWDHHSSLHTHDNTFSFFITQPGPGFEAPRLRVLEFSGDHSSRCGPGLRSCACCGAASISLQDLYDSVGQYLLPSLERIRVCNMFCVDLDFAGAMAKLLDLAPFVDVEPTEVYHQEVQPYPEDRIEGSALDIFRQLENPRAVQEEWTNCFI